RTATTSPGTRHVLDIRTPTGHHYRSTAPPLPGTPLNGDPPVMAAHYFGDLFRARHGQDVPAA
ncbi:hypothetical protein KNN17_18925, partial [Arthrobacter bambusae]|uniref:hypothetical protein n=1 Tax=Arthrobacter bambusae TaxID=1338426 RepID=UPI001F50913F